MESVLVLLSTYNGEKYLNEQLESIYSQKGVEVYVLVRDDCSTDNTIDILKKWESKSSLVWYSGENLKSAKSFMSLINKADKFKYYAFADQDDIWDDNKLKVGIDTLKKENPNQELLYCCSFRVVDEDLNLLRINKIDKLYSFGESMFRNNILGCTMIFNDKLIEVLKVYSPNHIEMHDSWTYRVCLAIGGKVILDKEPHINYRQHSSNVVGAKISKKVRIINRIKSLVKHKNYETTKTSYELLNGYEDRISRQNKEILLTILDYKNHKLRLIRNSRINKGKVYQKVLFALDTILENF